MKENCHEAKWWQPCGDGRVKCGLCPHGCVIAEGKTGICEVRCNQKGRLCAMTYNRPVALQVDPIEKKPLAHFMPGTFTFSIGTYGCNLNCCFCQNCLLSRGNYRDSVSEQVILPDAIVEMAVQHDCRSVAFTYNEPTVFAEYAIDIAKAAKVLGLATVLVSNGFITLEAAAEIYPLISAANIDIKGFSDEFYREMTGGRLQPVLDATRYFHSLGGHLEITNLVIPGKNDDPGMIDDLLDWVEKELNLSVPLHFSAYHPAHQYHESPRTPAETLYRIRDRAVARGFQHVHLGNII